MSGVLPNPPNAPPRYRQRSSRSISATEALEGIGTFLQTAATARSKHFAPRDEVVTHLRTMQTAMTIEAQLLHQNGAAAESSAVPPNGTAEETQPPKKKVKRKESPTVKVESASLQVKRKEPSTVKAETLQVDATEAEPPRKKVKKEKKKKKKKKKDMVPAGA